MCKTNFDYGDDDFIYHTSDNMSMNSNGDLYIRMGDNLSMDLQTEQLHITSGWTNEDDDDFKKAFLNTLWIIKKIYFHGIS